MTKQNFATKVLAISRRLQPDIVSKEKVIAAVSGEKPSTVRNWLFADKLPPKGKRLKLSDRFGVDVDYLFNNKKFNLPLTQYDSLLGCYLVPELKLSQLHCLQSEELLPIKNRVIISLHSDLVDNLKDVKQTYCIVSSGIDFEPFISAEDTLFINSTAKVIKCNFFLHVTSSVQIVQLEEDGTLKNKKGKPVVRLENEPLIPIIITMTTSYITRAN